MATDKQSLSERDICTKFITPARYNSSGAVIGKLSLRGNDLNFGLTPISDTYGVVSQANGVLTLVNMSTWKNAGTLVLLDPVTNGSRWHDKVETRLT